MCCAAAPSPLCPLVTPPTPQRGVVQSDGTKEFPVCESYTCLLYKYLLIILKATRPCKNTVFFSFLFLTLPTLSLANNISFRWIKFTLCLDIYSWLTGCLPETPAITHPPTHTSIGAHFPSCGTALRMASCRLRRM